MPEMSRPLILVIMLVVFAVLVLAALLTPR
jgi:hypothetical protein